MRDRPNFVLCSSVFGGLQKAQKIWCISAEIPEEPTAAAHLDTVNENVLTIVDPKKTKWDKFLEILDACPQ